MHADLVLLSGKFHTLDAATPQATALVAQGGKIVYLGDDATARGMATKGTEVIDLHGACVIPGLADAHLHMEHLARSLYMVNAETSSKEEALARVAERAQRTSAGQWIVGRGFNHNPWGDGDFPTKADLDRVAPSHPVALGHKSGHAMWVNSKALALAHITAATPDPAGGSIMHDASGEPTGILLEDAAMNLVWGLVPEPTLDELVQAMRQAYNVANRAGLTFVHDMDGPLALGAHELLHLRGELTLRVLKSIPIEELDKVLGLRLRTGFGDDMLRIGQIKMFADGALGPRTAWMLAPYETPPYDIGIATTPVAVLREAVLKANAAGLGSAIHAIGDRACREVLDIYQEAREKGVTGALRNRIEHVQILHPDDLGRLAELGVIASMQPLHATSDMHIADRHWGEERCVGAYALKTQLRCGAVLALGSDCPVEVVDPLVGLHAAVTRRRADGTPGSEGWCPRERLTVEEAVRGFTAGPAYAAGMEHKLGSLTVGKLADLTILDQDIFAIEPMEILHTHVLGTVVDGKFVWREQTL